MILALSKFDIVLMMNPDMDLKRRLGHFDTVVSPTTSSITYHHRNLATEITSLHGRDISQKFRLLESLRIKIKLRAVDLNFLKQCRDKKLIPDFATIKHRMCSSWNKKAFDRRSESLVRDEIKKT